MTTGEARTPGTAEVDPDAGAVDERLRRWRLVLGGDAADGTGCALGGQDAAMDKALTALYGKGDKPQSGRD
ncbi:hypothetical protein PV377_35765, partial [Streptomyces ipomoeae]|nr:hypothetical protein [Streptomyces ipomoeae]